MLELFRGQHQALLESLEEMKRLAEYRPDEAFTRSLEELQTKLRNNAFYLVVLGEFKRGKSTLVNSLLKTRLLPMAVVPLTSIVTVIRYGAEEKIEVELDSGKNISIARERLEEYVTERGNPKNVKGVNRVEIAFPSEKLQGGVHLIDTPGVGSIFESNTRATYDFLPKVDAALFLFTVDPPISRSELEFLGDVRQYVDKIFCIQNKVDYLDDADRCESMAFSKQVIEAALGDGRVVIHPLSAKLALEGRLEDDPDKLNASCLPKLEAVLTDFLTHQKGRILLKSALQSARKLLADQEFAVELARKAVVTPLRELEEKIVLFERQLERIQREKDDNGYFFEAEIKRIMDLVDHQLNRLRKTELPRLIQEFNKAAESSCPGGVKNYVESLKGVLNKGIVQTFDQWISDQEERLNQEFARVSKQYSDRANAIIADLVEVSSKLFGIQMEHFESEDAISADTRFYYLLGDPPRFFDLAGALDFFSQTLLPTSLSRHKVYKDLLKKLPERVDANCGRVRADFTYRIRESFLKFRWNLNTKIDATAASIRLALEQACEMQKVGSERKEKLLQELDAQLKRVLQVKSRLGQLAGQLTS